MIAVYYYLDITGGVMELSDISFNLHYFFVILQSKLQETFCYGKN